MTVRRIEPGDVGTVVAMVHELAAYERSRPRVPSHLLNRLGAAR